MTRYGRELSSTAHDTIKVVSERSRPHVGTPQFASQAQRKQQMGVNKVLIRPHRSAKTGNEVYDVVKLVGGKVEEVYVRDCTEFEEACQLAVMCMAGRTTVTLGNARTLLRGAQSGMLMPEHGLSRPVQGLTRKLPSGDFEVLPPKPPETKPKPLVLVDSRGLPKLNDPR